MLCATRAAASPPTMTAIANGYTRSSFTIQRESLIDMNEPTRSATNANSECHEIRSEPKMRSGSQGIVITIVPSPVELSEPLALFRELTAHGAGEGLERLEAHASGRARPCARDASIDEERVERLWR